MTRICAKDSIDKTVDAICLANDGNCVIGFSDGSFLLLTAESDMGDKARITDNELIHNTSIGIADLITADEALEGGFITKPVHALWVQREAEKDARRRALEISQLEYRLQHLREAEHKAAAGARA